MLRELKFSVLVGLVIPLKKGMANGFEEFEVAINDGSIVTGARKTMLFDDYSTNPFVIDITDEWNSVYYNDGGAKSSERLGSGPYLVNVKANNVTTLTEIVSDTDYDGISELATEFTLWDGNNDQEYFILKSNINSKLITLNDSVTYESADQVIYKIEELDQTWNSVDLTSTGYMTDSISVPMGKYKVSHDVQIQTLYHCKLLLTLVVVNMILLMFRLMN